MTAEEVLKAIEDIRLEEHSLAGKRRAVTEACSHRDASGYPAFKRRQTKQAVNVTSESGNTGARFRCAGCDRDVDL